MKCTHCTIHFHDNWHEQMFSRHNAAIYSPNGKSRLHWRYRSAECPGCQDVTIEIARFVFSQSHQADATKRQTPSR
jgi:hypothetical protein